jgi:hypothetical protein
MKRALVGLLVVFSIVTAMSGSSRAQCYGTLMLGADYVQIDRLVRLAIDFGDPSSIPFGVVCSRSMQLGETHFTVPIYAYNLHEGIQYLEFAVESNESLGVYNADGAFGMASTAVSRTSEGWRMNLSLQSSGPCCAPARLGSVEVVRVLGSDPIWIDLEPNSQTGKMYALDIYGQPHSAFAPRHGGYIGQSFLYACQPPLCEEPSAPVTDFNAVMGPSCSIKLTWTGGGGNRTMIRYRLDRYPTDYTDGTLVIEVPSSPGENSFFFQTGLENQRKYYYKAFSITRDASNSIVKSSFVECSSVDTLTATCEIAVRPVSWGAIKNLYQ